MRFAFVRVLMLGFGLSSFLMLASPSQGAAPNYEGNWKITARTVRTDIDLWLIQISSKEGKPEAKVLSVGLPDFDMTKIKGIETSDQGVSLKLSIGDQDFVVRGTHPKGVENPKALTGLLETSDSTDFIRLEKTTDTKIDPKTARRQNPEIEAYAKAINKADKKKQIEELTKLLDKKDLSPPLGFQVGLSLLQRLISTKADKAAINKLGEKIVESIGAYGNSYKIRALASVGEGLLGSEHPELALDYIQKARALHKSDKPTQLEANLLTVLLDALTKNKKEAEAKKVEVELEKVNVGLDKEFEKANIPFKVTPFAGRKGKSQRVTVVELFTGTECQPCIAADVAFDALHKAYKPTEVILLQYHNHTPPRGADPLTNEATFARHKFYGDKELRMPMALVNGTEHRVGGKRSDAEKVYGILTKAIDESLEKKAGAEIKLSATQKDGSIKIEAVVTGLEKPGRNMRLRFVLIEEQVRYLGGNGQRIHHHVVRDLPGGSQGLILAEKTVTETARISLDMLKASLDKYLNDLAKIGAFRSGSWPLELKNLKVVALVQNDETKEILNAAQVDLK